ncbi:hypothetical protein HPB50_007897 [Hyalomma asiaticum]|uniref:Uncharacterized protein n=1 Tax=Hyalomma asiaticum TaxID=266040 RepID=A0ACB7RTS4_HYAAI|nr:hypothetical protein HPB50_007897 [Hyalomma asiaticum]
MRRWPQLFCKTMRAVYPIITESYAAPSPKFLDDMTSSHCASSTTTSPTADTRNLKDDIDNWVATANALEAGEACTDQQKLWMAVDSLRNGAVA